VLTAHRAPPPFVLLERRVQWGSFLAFLDLQGIIKRSGPGSPCRIATNRTVSDGLVAPGAFRLARCGGFVS